MGKWKAQMKEARNIDEREARPAKSSSDAGRIRRKVRTEARTIKELNPKKKEARIVLTATICFRSSGKHFVKSKNMLEVIPTGFDKVGGA